MRGRLEDKVAIITGGTSGIGRKAVEIFAEEGASVLIGHNLVVDGGLTCGRLWSVQQEGLEAMRQALRDASKS